MRTPNPAEGRTFGQFVASVYESCGKGSPTGIVRLAVNAQLVEFESSPRRVIVGRIRCKSGHPVTTRLATL